MKAIGGYFEIEDDGIGVFPHHKGILLNTGRNALEYILRSIGYIEKIYVPYYTCEVVLEPIHKLNIPYVFYHIDLNFEIADEIKLDDGEYIIVNNYFGCKDEYIRTISEKFGERVIVDCAQAFFAPILPQTKMFYSMRKFVGVPDGGVAYGVKDRSKYFEIDDSLDRLSHLYARKSQGAEAGFAMYQENEAKLNGQEVKRISVFTRGKLWNINYSSIMEKRRDNFLYLHSKLENDNMLTLPSLQSFQCPMAYPYLPRNSSYVRKKLIDNRIYVARYWPNIKQIESFEREAELADKIIPLPIDQRYDIGAMNVILTKLK